MVLQLLELLECILPEWETTNAIATRTKQNWVAIFGQLCLLESKGYIEHREIKLSGKKNAYIWRKPDGTTTTSVPGNGTNSNTKEF